MRVALVKQHSGPGDVVVEEVPSPAVEAGQVVITVRAAGVNFPDVLLTQGKYQFSPPLPFSPGGEVAGVVKAIGKGVVTCKPGDRVIASMIHGGFAEEVSTDASRVVPLPDAVEDVPAAAFFLTYATSYYALEDRAHLRPGETLLVLGAAGGVGLAAIDLGKRMGARVIAAASSDDKLALCKERGADEVINYTTESLKDRTKALTRGEGADVVYDPVGGELSEQALRATNWNGRFLVVGFASGHIPKIPLNLVLLKSCQIVGVFWGAFTAREPERHAAHTRELLKWLAEGSLRPHVSATYPLERASEALVAMHERKVLGKVVIVP